MPEVIVSGSFDDIRSRHVRFLEEASRSGPVTVLLWCDETAAALQGSLPKFPLQERRYLIDALRFVNRVEITGATSQQKLFAHMLQLQPGLVVEAEGSRGGGLADGCRSHHIPYRVIPESQLAGFPMPEGHGIPSRPDRKKVVVTGCYDWLHSGHVRFFEEASALGDLYVVVGHDANVRQLKGESHPHFSQGERLYMVQAIRYVTQAHLTSGWGWMDAEPEITQVIRPQLYAVNEDGDVPEKRAFCQQHGIEYVVLKRKPKQGLPRRESTRLRGF
ncbi:MAG TPA: adenylyltransferase/cytidyltransferase family protein [Levilinea sp.]|nr:adenylyltransferase/cytidyltransferase family protein [Levilinea sp.]